MKKQLGKNRKITRSISPLNHRPKLRAISKITCDRLLGALLGVAAAWISLAWPAVLAQSAETAQSDTVKIQGTVISAAGNPVSEATVRLEQDGVLATAVTRTDAAGHFEFSELKAGSYVLSAGKSALHSRSAAIITSSPGDQPKVDLILGDSDGSQTVPTAPSQLSNQPMEFADKPNFTIAGVTDWTAVGGHGSDSSLRTSEALARETMSLKSGNPTSGQASSRNTQAGAAESESKLREAVARDPRGYEGNRQLGSFYLRAGRDQEAIPLLQAAYDRNPADRGNEYDLASAYKDVGDLPHAHQRVKELLAHGEAAEWHSLAGELDEKMGDPLSAVHEYQQAALLSPSEANYFEWGSELLLHRAVWQAQEVFQTAARAYPQSPRMLAALGTALFSGARYDEAAMRLCEASDLNPADPRPYEFMGKIELEAPNPLPCIIKKLERFVQQQPENALANYFYAMAIWKGRERSADERVLTQVKTLLTKAAMIDAQCADAYFQLGNVYSSQRDYTKAIGFYKRAIEVNPRLGDSHYRLGVAYDRTGERDKAQQEFKLHDQIKKLDADEIEKQRREVKQFLVVVPGEPAHPTAPEK